jgi:hypothetical protein
MSIRAREELRKTGVCSVAYGFFEKANW